jgi:hypothetical protein
VQIVRAALGEEAFVAAWGDGAKLTLEEAVALALSEETANAVQVQDTDPAVRTA